MYGGVILFIACVGCASIENESILKRLSDIKLASLCRICCPTTLWQRNDHTWVAQQIKPNDLEK